MCILERRAPPISGISFSALIEKEEPAEYRIGKTPVKRHRLEQHVVASDCQVLLIVPRPFIPEVDGLHRGGNRSPDSSVAHVTSTFLASMPPAICLSAPDTPTDPGKTSSDLLGNRPGIKEPAAET